MQRTTPQTTCRQRHAKTQTHAQTHARNHRDRHTDRHPQTHTHTQKHEHTHTQARTRLDTHTQTQQTRTRENTEKDGRSAICKRQTDALSQTSIGTSDPMVRGPHCTCDRDSLLRSRTCRGCKNINKKISLIKNIYIYRKDIENYMFWFILFQVKSPLLTFLQVCLGMESLGGDYKTPLQPPTCTDRPPPHTKQSKPGNHN